MKQNYLIIQPWILAYEGGFVNHPKDPGGATNQGVTQRTYDAYRRRIGHATQSVRRIDNVERDTIYRVQYWDAIKGDDLPSGVDAAVYDFAVNSGPSRAAKFLQRIVGVKQDGVIGLQTLDAVARMDSTQVIGQLCVDRMAFLRGLPTWGTFGKGWTRRVMGEIDGVQDGDTGIIDRATRLARGSALITKPKVIADGAGQRVGENGECVQFLGATDCNDFWRAGIMDYMPIARIILRYGVGLVIGAAQADMLAADADVVTVIALAVGGMVEVGYAIAKRRGGAT